MNGSRIVLLAMVAAWCGVLLASVATVKARHDARKLFVELQQLQQQRDELDIEWGQLRLEQSAYATHGQIERIANEKMGMAVPEPDAIHIVRRK